MSAREQGKAAELLTIQTDLTSDSAVDEITKATRAPFGRIDIPVNNAGIGPGSIRPDSWQRPLKFWRRIANGASQDDRCPRLGSQLTRMGLFLSSGVRFAPESQVRT